MEKIVITGNIQNTDYTSVNIDPKISPDFLIKVNERIPIADNSFETCLLFNVLEHIYDWDFIFVIKDY